VCVLTCFNLCVPFVVIPVADKAIMEEWAAQQERHEAARKAQVRQFDLQVCSA